MTDHFMTKAVRNVSLKRYMNLWRSLMTNRTGVKLLDYIMVKYRQKEFIKRA